jgi:hypothetical protein
MLLTSSLLQLLAMLTMAPTSECDNPSLDLTYMQEYKRVFASRDTIAALVTLVSEPLSREGRSVLPRDSVCVCPAG